MSEKKIELLKQTRRSVLVSGIGLLVAGCTAIRRESGIEKAYSPGGAPFAVKRPAMYNALPDERFPVPAVNISKVDKKFWRQQVAYETSEKVGSLIVDTPNKYLYHILPDGQAMRYGIGVGRAGFSWAGRAIVAYKRKWPKWTPPDEMVARQPELEPYSIANGGMAPGLRNPMGARGLYIHQNGRDTLYRLHGSPEEWTIGKAVSSGCIRLLNQDVIHLYDTVVDGSVIIVIPDSSMGQTIAI